MTEQEEA